MMYISLSEFEKNLKKISVQTTIPQRQNMTKFPAVMEQAVRSTPQKGAGGRTMSGVAEQAK